MKCPFLKKTVYNYPEVEEEHGPAMIEDRSQNPISTEEQLQKCEKEDCMAFYKILSQDKKVSLQRCKRFDKYE